jgi:hypothetical protein
MISSAQLLTAAMGQIRCPSDATTASLLRQCQIMQISSQARTGGVWVTSHMLLKGNTWTSNHCSYNSALEAFWSVRGVKLSLESLRKNPKTQANNKAKKIQQQQQQQVTQRCSIFTVLDLAIFSTVDLSFFCWSECIHTLTWECIYHLLLTNVGSTCLHSLQQRYLYCIHTVTL